jgi:hypothetical protein
MATSTALCRATVGSGVLLHIMMTRDKAVAINEK